jgi:hypothetical protein
MNPVITEGKCCPKCNTTLTYFANVEYCANCGQSGVGHRGDHCPRGCTGPVVAIAGAGRRCQQCGSQW